MLRIPPDQQSDSLAPSRPVTSNPYRLVASVPTSKPDA